MNILKTLYDMLSKVDITWIINSKTRQMRLVTKHLELMIASKKVLELIKVNRFDKIENNDDKIIAILNYVNNNIEYTSDSIQYKTPEYWAHVEQTLDSGEGDCEDGATLIYAMARLAGIPKEQLKIACGDVVGGGHCWVMYKSIKYPYGWYIIDWCYRYSGLKIPQRNQYSISKNIVYPRNNYLKIWFVSDESKSSKEVI